MAVQPQALRALLGQLALGRLGGRAGGPLAGPPLPQTAPATQGLPGLDTLGGLGALLGQTGAGQQRAVFPDERQAPQSFSPGGPVLNFLGGSPFPIDNQSRQLLAALTTASRLLDVKQAASKAAKKGASNGGGSGK